MGKREWDEKARAYFAFKLDLQNGDKRIAKVEHSSSGRGRQSSHFNSIVSVKEGQSKAGHFPSFRLSQKRKLQSHRMTVVRHEKFPLSSEDEGKKCFSSIF